MRVYMYKYMYEITGDFWVQKLGKDGKLYDDTSKPNYIIEVPIPIKYDSREEAEKCDCSLRFEVENGEVVLKIYSDWYQGFNKQGKWKEGVRGEVIDTIHWDDWLKYKCAKAKYDIANCSDITLDYEPDATKWNELFEINKFQDGWKNTVESLAYSINVIEVDEENI